jgi:hypothetical protein
MQTLEDVTAAHSRRISELQQRRDAALRAALAIRDMDLRALPAAAALFQRFDKASAVADDDRAEVELEASGGREAGLARAIDARSALFVQAEVRRKRADADARERKASAETAAQNKFRSRLDTLGPSTELEVRQKTMQDAEGVRRREIEAAAAAYSRSLSTAQAEYREAIDAAVLQERTAGRSAEQAYRTSLSAAASSHRAALASAERDLLKALQAVPEAGAAVLRYRESVAVITAEARREEEEAFRWFREQLKTTVSRARST